MDKRTLAENLSISPSGVEDKVKQGLLPAGVMWGGKLMWIWTDVETKLRGRFGSSSEDDLTEQVRHATRRAVNGR